MRFDNSDLGATYIIAVHNSRLGPGLGGCRYRNFQNADDALEDVLRLAEGMSYKNALCGIPFGGGKSVLHAPNVSAENRDALFLWVGECVDSLGGSYVIAEDMGTSVADIITVEKRTKHVSGSDPAKGGGGDPSPYTALGVFEGMKVAARHVWHSEDLKGRIVAVQGVGNVGRHLIDLLLGAGARIICCDPQQAHLDSVISKGDVQAVALDEIYDADCDILAPCAVGGVINSETVPRLQCEIIAGAANNQIHEIEAEAELRARIILYAPDFAINSGGVILCASESEPGGHDPERVRKRVLGIADTIQEVLVLAEEEGLLWSEAAFRLARARIDAAG